jgi:uncharacterized protein YdaU (DUF1376 family)
MSSARPDTWMPWYIGDYLRKTMHLDAEQDGAYRRLIDACWLRGGVLPNDDGQFAAIAKLTLKRWKAIKPVISLFFEITDHEWRHGRVTEEMARAVSITNERSEAGSKGAAKRWQKRKQSDGKAIGGPMPIEWQNDAPSQSHSSEAKASAGKPPDPIKALFDFGRGILTEGGRTDAEARSLVGKWRSQVGDDAELMKILVSAGKNAAQEPVAYVTAAIKGHLDKTAQPFGRAWA